MAEGGPRFETIANPEFGEIRGGFFGIVKKGTPEELAELLTRHPQRDRRGKLLYLLTSGMAVQLATGFEREHHDIDIVIMDPKNPDWEILGTDNVTPQKYWADMKFEPKVLEKTSATLNFKFGNKVFPVEIVHPVIIMTQKLSDAFHRAPRDKDVKDSVAVVKWWANKQKGNANWIRLVEYAIAALPRDERGKTEGRIETLVPKVLPLK